MESLYLHESNRHRAYLLLDGALLNAPRLAYTHDDNPQIDPLYRATRHDDALEVSPCLVKPSGDTRLLEEEKQWRANGIVVVAEGEFEALADHLRSIISVRLPDQTFGYLRFYAPSQIRPLLEVLNPAELSSFSGPIKEWRYYHTDGGWNVTATPEPVKQHSVREEGWFQLTPDHLQALSTEKHKGYVLKLTSYLGLSTTPENLERVDILVEQATARGFRSEADVAGYAELAVRFKDRLNHPSIEAVLQDSDRPAREKLSELDRKLAYGGA